MQTPQRVVSHAQSFGQAFQPLAGKESDVLAGFECVITPVTRQGRVIVGEDFGREDECVGLVVGQGTLYEIERIGRVLQDFDGADSQAVA